MIKAMQPGGLPVAKEDLTFEVDRGRTPWNNSDIRCPILSGCPGEGKLF